MATLGRRKTRFDKLIKATIALLLLGLLVQVITGDDPESRNPLASAVVFAANPFMRLGAAVHEGMGALWLSVFSAQRLQEENVRLREQLATGGLNESATRSREALDWLTQEVSTNIPPGTFELISAPVLALPPTSGRQIAWIGAGSDDGLEPGMIVLGVHGIVGEVDAVYTSSALVELVTDERAVWGAEVEKAGGMGLLQGTGDPLLVEMHFDVTAIEAKAGDRVVSSGMAGSIAPGGVPFGKIQEIKTNKRGEPIAVVRLPEKPGKLRTVFVLPQRRIPFEPGELK